MTAIWTLFTKRHDWRYGSVPLVCLYCGVERTKQNDREPCPARGAK